MELFILVVPVIAALLAVVSRGLRRDLYEQFRVSTWTSQGFVVGWRYPDEPRSIVHVTMALEPDTFMVKSFDRQIIFVFGSENPAHALYEIRGKFRQARKHGFNTMHYTPFMRFSMSLLNNREVRKEFQNASRD